MLKKRALQNLRQQKVIETNKYEEARRAGDQLGMRRARNAIESINNQIIAIVRSK